MGVKIAAVRLQNPGSTGNQDFTISGFGTPKAALFICSKSNSIGGASTVTGFAIGATDGTRQWVCAGAQRDAVGTSEVVIGRSESACAGLVDNSAASWDALASFVSWITDGVRINWSSRDAEGFITAILFGGTDLSAYCGWQLTDALGDYDITAPGFEPEMIFASGFYAKSDSSVQNNTDWRQYFGMAHNAGGGTVTQRGLRFTSQDNLATTEVASLFSEQYIGGHIPNMFAILNNFLVKDFDASGFTVNVSNQRSFGEDFNYLAIKTNGLASINLRTIDTPTSTGNQAYAGIGFQPNTLIFIPSSNTSVNTTQGNDTMTINGTIVDSASAEFGHAFGSQDNQATSNCSSTARNTICEGGAFGVRIEGTLVSYDIDGFTINYTNVSGSAHKQAVLSINIADETRKPDFAPFFEPFA